MLNHNVQDIMEEIRVHVRNKFRTPFKIKIEFENSNELEELINRINFFDYSAIWVPSELNQLKGRLIVKASKGIENRVHRDI